MVFISRVLLQEAANSAGIRIVGTTDCGPIPQAEAGLEAWRAAGHAGEMGYMMRRFPAMEQLLPGVKCVVSFAVYYDRAARPPLARCHGMVARYAWGRDYHKVLRRAGEAFVRELERRLAGTMRSRVFSDAVPLLERAIGERAGLGFIGRNSLLIRPGEGSFSFLGEVLLDAEVENTEAKKSGGSCGSCVRCIADCPTGAIVADGTIDARRCISYLTIEKRSALSRDERAAIGAWLFGCDICQDVCPFNHRGLKREAAPHYAELSHSAGAGSSLDVRALLAIRTHEEFSARFAGTPLMRAKREGLLRNAAVVAANTDCGEAAESLAAALEHDASPMVRQHCLWALFELGERCDNPGRAWSKKILERGLADQDADVRREAEDLAQQARIG
jgi:epoxyqueuosine reductase